MTAERQSDRQHVYTPDGKSEYVERQLPRGLLSHDEILALHQEHHILIDPFDEQRVGPASYDVGLGMNYFREHKKTSLGAFGESVNLWADDAAARLWNGPFTAISVKDYLRYLYAFGPRPSLEHENISENDHIIVLQPGENILAHTTEFIGGDERIDTSMHARSSLGRSHITVCRCAGLGDPGYCNIWTCEITNNSRTHPVILVVGRRIAQIVFWEITPVERGYGVVGKYQRGVELDEIKRNWKPEDMLPKLAMDREARTRAEELAKSIAIAEEQRIRSGGAKYAFEPQPPTFNEVCSDFALAAYWLYLKSGVLNRRFDAVKSVINDESLRLHQLVFEMDPPLAV
jgi:dCTP deaminase